MAACTVTSSLTPPICSATVTVSGPLPTVAVCVDSANPGARTRSVYWPGATPANENEPSALDRVPRVRWDPPASNVISALATLAPCGSTTRPLTLADCAHAGAQTIRNWNTTTSDRCNFRIRGTSTEEERVECSGRTTGPYLKNS